MYANLCKPGGGGSATHFIDKEEMSPLEKTWNKRRAHFLSVPTLMADPSLPSTASPFPHPHPPFTAGPSLPPAPSLFMSPPQQPFVPQQVLAQRLAVVFGGNQRLQQCQDKISEVTEKVSERWKTYHNDQVAFAELQRECGAIRTEVHSLQLKLAEKLLEQRTKALESEHSLRHINDLLGQSRALREELDTAKHELSTFTAKLEENITAAAAGQVPFIPAAFTQLVNPAAAHVPPIDPEPEQQNENNGNEHIGDEDGEIENKNDEIENRFVAVKRERSDTDTFGDNDNDSRRIQTNVHVHEKEDFNKQGRDACLYFNKRGGCLYNAYRCKRSHRCSICWGRDHGATQCDIEVYDRRR